jgi:hypothetical protein
MKCPDRKIKTIKIFEKNIKKIIKVHFGDCYRNDCMAYDPYAYDIDGKCAKYQRRKKCQTNS